MGEGVDPSMGKEERIENKVKHLLRKLNAPRWLHHFGPKTYELYMHLAALLIKTYCKLSYRRIVKLLNLLGIKCPSKSALQSTAKKIPKWMWDKALELTSGVKHHIIAIDGTGFSRTNPSYHYLRRIDGKMPKVPIKLSGCFDTRTKKWCAAKVRVLPAHDIRDAKYLLDKVKANILVADKGYDANWLHEYCAQRSIEAHIPVRNKGKAIHKMWSYRRKASEHFRVRTYHRRELIESGNGSIKRKYGHSVSSKNCKTIRAEVMSRLLTHNLFGYNFRDSGQSQKFRNIYIQTAVYK